MACMEHWCTKCGHTEFNNSAVMYVCKKCGAESIISHCDEQDDYERDYDQEDDDE